MYQVTELSTDIFASLLPGLDRIKQRCPDVSWDIELIFTELLDGRTRLFLDKDYPGDFLIVRLDWNSHRKEAELFVRVAYSASPVAKALFEKKLVKLAEYFSASRVTMMSSRRGFKNYGGWKAVSMLYSMEIC